MDSRRRCRAHEQQHLKRPVWCGKLLFHGALQVDAEGCRKVQGRLQAEMMLERLVGLPLCFATTRSCH